MCMIISRLHHFSRFNYPNCALCATRSILKAINLAITSGNSVGALNLNAQLGALYTDIPLGLQGPALPRTF